VRIALICVGRLKAGPERELFDRYFKRLSESARAAGVAGVDLHEIKEARARRPEQRRAEEAAAILAVAPPGAMLVALDERGASLTSQVLALDVARARDASKPAYAVVIGGPDGLDASVGQRADRIVAFGAMTWPHQLVRVMACEQLYRAVTILCGHPYHRDSRRDIGSI